MMRPLPVALRRSWVFLSAANVDAFAAAWRSQADALIADLEDSTPPHLREQARAALADFVGGCRAANKVACVRINSLAADGVLDMQAVRLARPDAILLPKTESPREVNELAALLDDSALEHVEIVPNIETTVGLVKTLAIASAHRRVSACLLASEDLTTSLGAERGRDGTELLYARSRFLVECKAAGVVPIDCPYTFSDIEGLSAETRFARRLGYSTKSAVAIEHAATINSILTPSEQEVARARHIVAEFERAHSEGRRAEVDGNFLEVPIYRNAQQLLKRHAALHQQASTAGPTPT